MWVTVAGPRGGVVREEETLFAFASRCADILNIIDRDIDLEIIVSESLDRVFGILHLWIKGSGMTIPIRK